MLIRPWPFEALKVTITLHISITFIPNFPRGIDIAVTYSYQHISRCISNLLTFNLFANKYQIEIERRLIPNIGHK